MSNLRDITERLRDTQATIAQTEDGLLTKKPTPSVLLALDSLRKRQKNLELQFEKLASAREFDICNYRVFYDEDENERPSLRAFAGTLLGFQDVLTQVYAAINTDAPRTDGRIAAEIAKRATLGFNYSFTGSLGAVLTVKNEQLLFDSDIDESIKIVTELVKQNDPQEISNFAERLGMPSIKSLYEWTSSQVKAGVGSQIEWKKGNEVFVETTVQLAELVVLKESIEATSDIVETELELKGRLVGIDINSRTFHLEFEEGEDIKGKFDKNMDTGKYEVPKRYLAKLTKSTKITYATGKKDELYILTSLS